MTVAYIIDPAAISNADPNAIEAMFRRAAAHDAGRPTVFKMRGSWWASFKGWSPYGPCATQREAFGFAHYVMAPWPVRSIFG
jgi:hypothetical protein